MRIKNVGVLVNDRKTEAFPHIRECLTVLQQSGATVSLLHDNPFTVSGSAKLSLKEFFSTTDIILVFGGDGSLLGAARLAETSQIPLVGINTGTLGFLTSAGIDTVRQVISDIVAGNFSVEKRMMLDIAVMQGSKIGSQYTVLNDLVISRNDISRLMTMAVHSGRELINDYFADGLVFATPTGSTAYSLSAGGPLVEPGINAIVISPICPHSLSERPLIVSGERNFIVTFGSSTTAATLTLDGQLSHAINPGDRVRIKKSSHQLALAYFEGSSFFATLRSKLLWGHHKTMGQREDPTC